MGQPRREVRALLPRAWHAGQLDNSWRRINTRAARSISTGQSMCARTASASPILLQRILGGARSPSAPLLGLMPLLELTGLMLQCTRRPTSVSPACCKAGSAPGQACTGQALDVRWLSSGPCSRSCIAPADIATHAVPAASSRALHKRSTSAVRCAEPTWRASARWCGRALWERSSRRYCCAPY